MDHELVKSITSIVQAATGILIPVAVIILGLKINRQLEASKIALTREKEWRTKWAESFYDEANLFAKSMQEYAFFLSQLQHLGDVDTPEKEDKYKAIVDAIKLTDQEFTRREWLMKTGLLSFAPKNTASVLKTAQSASSEL